MFLFKIVKPTVLNTPKLFLRNAGSYKLVDFSLYKLDSGPATECTIKKEDALKMYRNMVAIRRMENLLASMYRKKFVRGFCHLYNGQEAIACGMVSVARKEDTFITSYRAHGFTYLLGDLKAAPIIAELAGRIEGCSRGKGGSMHVYAKNFFGGNGIVGSQVPLGTGVGLYHKYKETKGISFTLYGDGAANQGQVYESFNIASLWNLPIVFICENNLYGMGTATHRSSANTDYYTHCSHIPGVLADGMDILSVREATKFAIDHVMNGKGPIIIEMRAYRYFGHSMSDPGSSYRTRDEIKSFREQRDPIKKFAERVTSDSLVSNEEIEKINKEIGKEIKDIGAKVLELEEVEMDELTADIYKNNLEDNIRGTTPFNNHKHKNTKPGEAQKH